MRASADAASPKPVFDGMKVDGKIDGCLFSGTITHRYCNRSDQCIEATNFLIVPPQAALTGLTCSLRGTSAAAEVVPYAHAHFLTEQAIEVGDTGVVVNHAPGHRSAVYIRAGTLHPGDELELAVRLVFPLSQVDGCMRLVIPTALARKGGQASQHVKYDYSADYPFEVSIEVCGPAALARISSPENLAISRANGGGKLISCRRGMTSDFVCDFRGMPKKSFIAVGQADENKIAMMVRTFPESLLRTDDPVSAKILVDCSSSMAGPAMEQVRALLFAIRDKLGERDACTLSKYGSTCIHAAAEPIAADDSGRVAIEEFIGKLSADMGNADIALALEQVSKLPGRGVKEILLLTCGSADDIERIASAAGSHRCFIIGIGNADHNLLHDVAQHTRGIYMSLQGGDDVKCLADTVLTGMRAPRASHIGVAWPSKPVWQVDPRSVTGVHPLDCYACFDAKPASSSQVSISYSLGGKKVTESVDLAVSDDNPEVAELAFAMRSYILHLEQRKEEAQTFDAASRILSPSTSFVFYERRPGMANTLPQHMPVHVPYPDGLHGTPARYEDLKQDHGTARVAAMHRLDMHEEEGASEIKPHLSERSVLQGWMLDRNGLLWPSLPPDGDYVQMAVRGKYRRPGYESAVQWLYAKSNVSLLFTLIKLCFPAEEDAIRELASRLHSMRAGLPPVLLVRQKLVPAKIRFRGKYPLFLGEEWLLFRLARKVEVCDLHDAADFLGVDIVAAAHSATEG